MQIYSQTASASWVTRQLLEKPWRRLVFQLCLEVMGYYRYNLLPFSFIVLLITATSSCSTVVIFSCRLRFSNMYLCLPWYMQSTEEGIKLAHEIGFPVMIKVGFYTSTLIFWKYLSVSQFWLCWCVKFVFKHAYMSSIHASSIYHFSC